MKIKHNQTGEIREINFKVWKDEYIPKRLDINYTIVSKDTVFLRKINYDGTREFLEEIERVDAMQQVRMEPKNYDFIEHQVVRGKVSFLTDEHMNLSYEDFKARLGDHLKGDLDNAYLFTTGKMPPTITPEGWQEAEILEHLELDNSKAKNPDRNAE